MTIAEMSSMTEDLENGYAYISFRIRGMTIAHPSNIVYYSAI